MDRSIPVRKDELSFRQRQERIWDQLAHTLDMDREGWDREINHMHNCLLGLNPHQPISKSSSVSHQPVVAESSAHQHTIKDIYGNPMFRARFNVKLFDPKEIEVRTEGGNVWVHAKHEQSQMGDSEKIEYSRQVALPDGVDSRSIHCTLSSDGILTAEAQLKPPAYSPTSGQSVLVPVSVQLTRSSPSPARRRVSADSEKSFSAEVDLRNFTPENVSIRTLGNKVMVTAEREERVGNKVTKKRTSREFTIQPTADATRVKAHFDNGKLYIEAPPSAM